MNEAVPESALQPAPPRWPPGAESEPLVAAETSLAETLLAIQQKRGALYMVETSRYLIEKWDLRSDQLRAQTDETVSLVDRLLRR
jgi:hypothetical protein